MTSTPYHVTQLSLFSQSLAIQPQVRATIFDSAIERWAKPVGRSLNPSHKIKPLILKYLFKKTGRTPAQLYPLPVELYEYLTSPMSDQDRKIWYLVMAKYKNNLDVR